ncbi:uncharacterized protein EI97DRAFT_494930 [Westerdykella ornata]|uniref:Calcium-dependent phosphotriesterase n=1 Tax=Westerdykella ornata TaxID=318751 RepID=A0A6A6JEI2_WESOR|nr:uncharacterized protein EI97DRAFT_494930 [Westerdykella ornata]KAF2275020.1 hypothetical protein EI97DRAFT_494930 [Westerdykella ornata]
MLGVPILNAISYTNRENALYHDSLGVLAGLSPWLYDRYQIFSHMMANRPGKLIEINAFKSHDVLFQDAIRNCEDVVLAEKGGIAILSCDAGRDNWNTVMGTFKSSPTLPNGAIHLLTYSTDPPSLRPLTLLDFPNAQDFHPLGLSWDPISSTLYVVNHAHNASVLEIFSPVDLAAGTATHSRTLKHPLLHAPNAILDLGAGRLIVSNDHSKWLMARRSKLLAQMETWSGIPGGSVVYIDTKDPRAEEKGKVLAWVPFANGVERLNKTTVVVGSSSMSGLYFYNITEEADGTVDLTPSGFVRTPVAVDNLSLEEKTGKLLVAGHPFAPALVDVAIRRGSCNSSDFDGEVSEKCKCNAPSWAAEWSEEGGLRVLYQGYAICGSTTAVRDGERRIGVVTGLYDRGIMVFKQ